MALMRCAGFGQVQGSPCCILVLFPWLGFFGRKEGEGICIIPPRDTIFVIPFSSFGGENEVGSGGKGYVAVERANRVCVYCQKSLGSTRSDYQKGENMSLASPIFALSSWE